MEFISIGDLHLTDDAGIGGLSKYVEDADEQVMEELKKIFKWGLKRGIRTAIFKGDICENPRMSYRAQIAFTAFLKSKLARRFDIHIILGNHDKMAADSLEGHSLEVLMLNDLPHVHIYTEDTVVEFSDCKVNFMPWPSTKFRKSMLNIAHVEVKGSKMDSGRVFDGDHLPNTKAVAVIGHLHTAHKVGTVHYIGTFYQTNFGESIKKYFAVINFRSPEDYEVELIPHKPKYTLHNCIISSAEDLEKLPQGEHELCKVIIEEGADIGDYKFKPNVVHVKAFKTKQELATILSEDLKQGEELVVRSSEVFKKWLAQRQLEPKLAKRVMTLRKQILGRATA